MVLELQPKDTRNYFMLPQAPEEADYYVYGIPARERSSTHIQR